MCVYIYIYIYVCVYMYDCMLSEEVREASQALLKRGDGFSESVSECVCVCVCRCLYV